MTRGLVAFLTWGQAGAVAVVAGCRANAGPGFRCVLLCLQIIMKIKILNQFLKKQKYLKLMWKVSLMCCWHLCSDK